MPIIPETEMAGPAAPAAGLTRSRGSTDDLNVFDDARTYYTAEERHRNNRAGPRTRTYSQVGVVAAAMGHGGMGALLTNLALQNSLLRQMERVTIHEPYRRGSHGRTEHTHTPESVLNSTLTLV
jgi:alpha,alpha-trehalase